MNYNTLSPGARLIKKLQNFATGQMVTSGDVPNIAVINAGGNFACAEKLVDVISAGVRNEGGTVNCFCVPAFGFLNKVNPATAKYADSFKNTTASSTEAIIRTNLIDGIIVVSDCDVTVAGVMMGCLRSNCPIIVMTAGCDHSDDKKILKLNGEILAGERGADLFDGYIVSAPIPYGITDSSTNSTFFHSLTEMGFVLEGAVGNKRGLGRIMQIGYESGQQIVKNAKNIISPRKAFTKQNFATAVQKSIEKGASISGLELLVQLAIANGEKIGHSFFADLTSKMNPSPILLLRGSVCENGGYVQPMEDTPIKFSGKAWVYYSLEDADAAISKGNINGGVIVLHNCVGMNISQIIYTIEGMGRISDFAVLTDGVCERSSVLVVTKCSPNSLENDDFANIQTGDVIDIDLGRGRINTSVLAKDMKARAKRGSVKKQNIYFV